MFWEGEDGLGTEWLRDDAPWGVPREPPRLLSLSFQSPFFQALDTGKAPDFIKSATLQMGNKINTGTGSDIDHRRVSKGLELLYLENRGLRWGGGKGAQLEPVCTMELTYCGLGESCGRQTQV